MIEDRCEWGGHGIKKKWEDASKRTRFGVDLTAILAHVVVESSCCGEADPSLSSMTDQAVTTAKPKMKMFLFTL